MLLQRSEQLTIYNILIHKCLCTALQHKQICNILIVKIHIFINISRALSERSRFCTRLSPESFSLSSEQTLARMDPLRRCPSPQVCKPRRCSPAKMRFDTFFKTASTSSWSVDETIIHPHEERHMSFAPHHQSLPRLIIYPIDKISIILTV